MQNGKSQTKGKRQKEKGWRLEVGGFRQKAKGEWKVQIAK